jgi:hypothetical protein
MSVEQGASGLIRINSKSWDPRLWDGRASAPSTSNFLLWQNSRDGFGRSSTVLETNSR